MSISIMLIGYLIIVVLAVLALCSKDAVAPVRWWAGFAIVGSTLAVVIALFVNFSVKAGFIRF